MKVALITGGTRGIGLGIASALAEEGFSLALCGRKPESDVASVLEDLHNQYGTTVKYLSTDLGDPARREKIVPWIKAQFGHLNVLVNNAGMAPRRRGPILTATEESYDEVMRVNLKGPYFLTRDVANFMIENQPSGAASCCIINVNSISATVASPSRGEYCISKAGMAMSTQLWAVALAPHGIPVYEIRPGITETDMTSGVQEKYDKLIEEGLLLQPRWGKPADSGKAVAMLARGDLPYSTGQIIMIDGGLTVQRL